MIQQFIHANPFLERLKNVATPTSQAMGLRGITIKTLFLLAFVFGGFFIAVIFQELVWANTALVWGVLAMIIIVIATLFLPKFAWITGPVVALIEGLLLGNVVMAIESVFPGSIINAILLTIALLAAICLFQSFVPVPTPKVVVYLTGLVGAIALVYLADFILNFFGGNVMYLHTSGVIAILLAIVLGGLVALNLLGDFAFIDERIKNREGKEYEWYVAFSLVLTLIWMYFRVIEVIILMARERK